MDVLEVYVIFTNPNPKTGDIYFQEKNIFLPSEIHKSLMLICG